MDKRFGIIAAMREECENFILVMKNTQTSQIGHIIITEGQYLGHHVIVICCGIGKVNAAVAATLLIKEFNPDYIINTGSAGGFAKDLNIGDVIIAKAAAFHDVDVTVFGYEYGQLPGQPLWFESDSYLHNMAQNGILSQDNHRIRSGNVISGDSFISQKQQLIKLHERFSDADIIDMEAAAIAQVCHIFQKPLLVVRSVSDLVHKENPMDFKEFLPRAAQNALDVVTHIIREVSHETNC